jgi:hypothetical protein
VVSVVVNYKRRVECGRCDSKIKSCLRTRLLCLTDLLCRKENAVQTVGLAEACDSGRVCSLAPDPGAT